LISKFQQLFKGMLKTPLCDWHLNIHYQLLQFLKHHPQYLLWNQ